MRLLSQERSNLGVIESRTVKLAWQFMRIQACGDSLIIASVLQALANPIFVDEQQEPNASSAYRWTRTGSATDCCERVETKLRPTRAPQ